jgi:Flp pilus assembly protein TadD
MNAFVSCVWYALKMLYPTNLAVVYPYVWPLPWFVIAGSVIAVIGATALAVMARRYPFVAVGWFWYLITLAPVIGIVQVGSQPRADRYTYIPLIGLFITVVWGAAELLARARVPQMVAPAAAVAVIVACAVTARGQAAHWKNNVTLWEHTLAATTGNARAHNNLGNALSDLKKNNEAIEHYKAAIQINPKMADAYNNLGNSYAAMGKINEAVESYKAGLRLAPDNAQAHNGLGSSLDDQGKYAEAIVEYAEALRLDPTLIGAHNNLAVALLKQGKVNDAIQQFRETVRLDPAYADYHYNLAVALQQAGQSAEAADQLQTTLKLDPQHQAARQALQSLPGQNKP